MIADMPKMPEPVATALSSGIANDLIRVRVRPNSSVDVGQKLYTADQMREFANEATRQAMERAAKVCDYMVKANFDYSAKGAARDCASAIRTRALSDVAAQEGRP